MSNTQFFIYLLILSSVTYLIRVIPFVLFKEKINNRFVKSFLYYIPYAVLTCMTVPAIVYAPDVKLAAIAGLVVAVIVALRDKSLTFVAVAACMTVFAVETVVSLM